MLNGCSPHAVSHCPCEGCSIFLYLLAVVTLVLLPAVSVKMYVDDNALMPGRVTSLHRSCNSFLQSQHFGSSIVSHGRLMGRQCLAST